jgi:hypothetical protein
VVFSLVTSRQVPLGGFVAKASDVFTTNVIGIQCQSQCQMASKRKSASAGALDLTTSTSNTRKRQKGQHEDKGT